jgi:hypothetical protein
VSDTCTWTVTRGISKSSERVTADAWLLGPNGDLVFYNGEPSVDQFFVRAFAAGTWEKVSLYA